MTLRCSLVDTMVLPVIDSMVWKVRKCGNQEEQTSSTIRENWSTDISSTVHKSLEGVVGQ